jgi:hypothetical protein
MKRMKKLICSAVIISAMSAKADIVKMGGTFDGTVSGGQVHGKCNPSSKTCWEYNTETRALTIYLTVVQTFPDANEPVLDNDGYWTAVYE